MSYEGFTEALCSNGHLRLFGLGQDVDLDPCSCGGVFVFTHDVDQTNDDGVRYPFVVATHGETQTCNLGHVHIVREVTYKIPDVSHA